MAPGPLNKFKDNRFHLLDDFVDNPPNKSK